MYKLRELERKDLVEINRWRNDPGLICLLGAPFRYINFDVDEKWFENYMLNRNSTLRCAIVSENCDEILGLVSLTGIDYINLSATLHIMIGSSNNQGKSVGTFAVSCMINHAFYNMNLHRIDLTVLSNNERAIHLYEKIGFVLEGRKRKCVYKNGEYIDMLCYALLRGEEKYDKSICIMNGGGVSNYSLDYVNTPSLKEMIIQECDDAFLENHIENEELVKKVRIAAEMLVAYNTNILGYCAFYANNSETQNVYITLIAVKPMWQNKHIGRRLLDALMDVAISRRMLTISLEVKKNNKKAIDFYVKNGFTIREKTNVSYLMSKSLKSVI